MTTFQSALVRTAPPLRLVAALVYELRPHQWVKNLVCLAGLIFSCQLFEAAAIGRSLLGLVAFCVASSAVYLLNDIVDRERDRNNPRTAGRPIASGELPLALAIVALLVLLVGAGHLAGRLGWACLATLLLYGFLNVCYSFHLKQAVIADVMCIALGFVLRVVFGVYAVGVRPTAWIVLCMFFLALFLGFAKRRAELAAQLDRPGEARPVLRHYSRTFLDIVLAISATTTILCYALFTVASQRNPTLIVTIVPVVYCVTRYLLHVLVHNRGESPDAVLFSDRHMWVGVFCWLGLCVGILYTDVRLFDTAAPKRATTKADHHRTMHRLKTNTLRLRFSEVDVVRITASTPCDTRNAVADRHPRCS
jgi:4-hydroxybenzoate polyprenyltransferase